MKEKEDIVEIKSELDLCDTDIAEMYRGMGSYIIGTPLLAQLVRELKKLNDKK